jgi:pimeloyl-ACP methyl ester carboxylesterase
MTEEATTIEWKETRVPLAGQELLVLEAGEGRPLLVLHEELGNPGPLRWQAEISKRRKLIVPLHPGFGRTERYGWVASMRDLACLYGRYLREQKLSPIDVIGFSLGGWLAAEMISNDPSLFSKMVLVSAPGIRPPEGEILDLFMLTGQTYLQASVKDARTTPEFTSLYGATQTPEQFAAWEECRAETARLAWSPYMFDPSLPQLLDGVRVPTLVVCGADDRVVPTSVGRAYAKAISGAKLAIVAGVNHRPEIENRDDFLRELSAFLG